MKQILLILLGLFLSIGLFAQSNIRGEILDDQSNGIPGAHIQIENTNYTSVSDNFGNFSIFNIPEGNYNLIISYIGYDNLIVAIELIKGETLIENFNMINDGIMLNDIVINARLEGQAKALNRQKNNLNITEIVSSEQLERFPDANIGDALKRVSGINVIYDQGEARFAAIRGTSPELNSVTINGERVPSAEAENRSVQLDLIPSDMIETIELSKAITPDMDGDAIGGSINLVTQKASAKQKISGTLGSGYSFLASKPIFKGKITYSNRFANNKLGLILNASILDKKIRSDNIEPEWDYTDENDKNGTAFTSELQTRQYYVERLRQSYSATLDYNFNDNHKIFVIGLYNWRNDWENRYRLNYKDIEKDNNGNYITQIRRQTKGGIEDNKYGRLEDQKMYSFNGGGEHFFDKIKVNWSLSSMKANEDRPNERYISMRVKKEPITLDLSNIRRPKVTVIDPAAADLSDAFSLKELSEEFKYTEEKDFNGKIDVVIPTLFGKNSSNIKVGTRFKNKSKNRNNNFKEYEPLDEDAFVTNAINNKINQTNADFSLDDYQIGSFVSKQFLGNLDLTNGFDSEVVLEESAGNFEAEEHVFAAYAMYTQNIGEKWSIIGGIRLENTKVKNQGKIFDGNNLTDTDVFEHDYSNLMPGIHIKFSPNNYTNIRFAWTNTLARPNYFDLVPYQEIETDDNLIKIGNPSLEATTSMNFDLLGEYFFKNIGIVSGGVFYKDLSNIIAEVTLFDYNFNGHVYDIFTEPINTGDASLYGFEFGLQRRLDFLPGFLENLSLYTNYTYTKSELKNIKIENRESETLPLTGTPESVFNISLAFDTKNFDIRLSYNHAGEFIEEYSDESFFDRWYDAVDYLDLNANYKINKHFKIYVSFNNLLDQPLRYYQGIKERTMQEEYYGVDAKLGIKFKF